jgi:FkbM family methyltransferase
MCSEKNMTVPRPIALLSYLPDLVSRVERPWRLVADRLGLIGGTYVLRTRDGSAFELRGGTGDRFSVFEIAIRRDYFNLVKIKPGDVIVDIGANIGVFTVIASKLIGSHGRVIAIEPNSESAKQLERNIALNRLNNVTVYRAAVTGAPGNVTLHTGKKAILSSIFTSVDGQAVGGSAEEVRGLPLADILAREKIDRVDLLKIDCEGGEYEIFDAAESEIWTKLSQIVMEVHHVENRRPAELVAKLRGVGYLVQEAGLLYAQKPMEAQLPKK